MAGTAVTDTRDLRELILGNGQQLWCFKASNGDLPANSPKPQQHSLHLLEVLTLLDKHGYCSKLILRDGDSNHRYYQLCASKGRHPTVNEAMNSLLEQTATFAERLDAMFCEYTW